MMIVNVEHMSSSIEPCICVGFGNGVFTLNYDGNYNAFLNDFIPMLNDFVNQVIDDYEEATKKPSYEDCFDAMISDFETVDCPYWKYSGKAVESYYDTITAKVFASNEDKIKRAAQALNKCKFESDNVTLKDFFDILYKENKDDQD